MEIEVTQEKLAIALNNVSRVAVGKVTLPVLNNVLIRVDNKKVSLTTTNLDMAVVDYLPVSSSKDGVITVDHKTDFKPGDIDKYTIVLWIEGSDPECNDNILGGEIKISMNFVSEHTEI